MPKAPSHYKPPREVQPIVLEAGDKEVLRELASELASIAALPVHREKAQLWTRLNDLDSERPLVWINEICWNEMNVDDELTLRCGHPWARGQEWGLRQQLYQWRHLPGDMVVNDYMSCPLAIHSSDFGINEDVDIVKTDETSDVVSRHFNVQIQDRDDLEKIRMPTVSHDEQATDTWHPDRARQDIREFLDLAGGQCHIELIMKDISTVRYEPQRLWEWASIAMEEAQA